MATKLNEVKSPEVRKVEISSMLSDIDNGVVSSEIPEDVSSIINAIDGLSVRELVKSDLKVNKALAHSYETKKGKTIYEVFSTGFGLVPIKKAGNRLLKMKLQLFIE